MCYSLQLRRVCNNPFSFPPIRTKRTLVRRFTTEILLSHSPHPTLSVHNRQPRFSPFTFFCSSSFFNSTTSASSRSGLSDQRGVARVEDFVLSPGHRRVLLWRSSTSRGPHPPPFRLSHHIRCIRTSSHSVATLSFSHPRFCQPPISTKKHSITMISVCTRVFLTQRPINPSKTYEKNRFEKCFIWPRGRHCPESRRTIKSAFLRSKRRFWTVTLWEAPKLNYFHPWRSFG